MARAEAKWTAARAVAELKRLGEKKNVEGMARFGIRAKKVFGVSKPKLDELAKKIGKNHELGMGLWKTGIHDARLLGVLISEPEKVSAKQMERWVKDFDNWDVCDGTCCHLFVFAAPAWKKAFEWTRRKKEFEKRAGFALAAFLVVHDKRAADASLYEVPESNRARSLGRPEFRAQGRELGSAQHWEAQPGVEPRGDRSAERIRRQDTRAARWIAADALRELRSEAVQRRLRHQAV